MRTEAVAVSAGLHGKPHRTLLHPLMLLPCDILSVPKAFYFSGKPQPRYYQQPSWTYQVLETGFLCHVNYNLITNVPFVLTMLEVALPLTLLSAVPQPVIRCSLQCRDLVDEAKKFHLRPELRSQMQGPRTRARLGKLAQRGWRDAVEKSGL